MFDKRLQGLFWCMVFVILDAIQAVYFGGVLQEVDSFLLGGLVFGLSALACILWSAIFRPEQFRFTRLNLAAVIGLNVTAAGGWLFYLLAVQMIEPAVSFTIFAGSVPLVTIAAAYFGVPEAEAPRNRQELIGNSILAVGLLTLAAITVLGLSGFVRGDIIAAVTGLVFSLVAGVLITGMLLYGQRLDRVGLDPVTQFGLRFPLFVLLCAVGVTLGIDSKGPIEIDELFMPVAIGFVVLAFPIYAVQKAISLTTSLTIAALAGTAPLFVVLFQILEGRVTLSFYTTIGLCICFLGSIFGALGAASEDRKKALKGGA